MRQKLRAGGAAEPGCGLSRVLKRQHIRQTSWLGLFLSRPSGLLGVDERREKWKSIHEHRLIYSEKGGGKRRWTEELALIS
jgi:hypothetical protein